MSITFNQFLTRIDEANVAGSRPRPRGKDVLTSAERARVSTRRDRTPIQRTGGGVSYVTISPKKEEKPEPPKNISKTYIQKWIPGFPPPKDMKVKSNKKIKLKKPEKKQKTKRVKTRQLTLRLREFVELYRQSITES